MEIISIDSSDDEKPIASAPKNKLRLITPRVQTDSDCCDSSVSSNDSIWDKGICSRRAVEVVEKVAVCDGDGSICSNDILEKVGLLSIDNDRAKCDESSVSSDDSIWNKGVPSLRQDKVTDQRAKKSSSSSLKYVKSSSNHTNKSSNKTMPPRRDTSFEPIECHYPDNNSNDDSSASSQDSILDKKYFERKKHPGKAPINSFYDYCRYYANKPTANQDTTKSHDEKTSEHTNRQTTPLPPEVPLPTNATWKIILLMDHREFGTSNNFLQHVESQINSHFGAVHSEITTLPSADYLYVARLISDDGHVLDERVLDMVIERKAVQDVCSCLVTDSKKYKPLSFFEAQMFKLQNCGMGKKLFVMEGDEDRTKGLFHGARSQQERERRLKRVKTLR